MHGNKNKNPCPCMNSTLRFLPLKKQRPSLASVHSQVLQNVAVRIDLAFKAFFRRVGESLAILVFRGKGRYDSFTFPQSGFSLDGNILRLSKIGNVKVVLHAGVEGPIKTCTIKRSSTDKWYVMFFLRMGTNPFARRITKLSVLTLAFIRLPPFQLANISKIQGSFARKKRL